MSDIKELYRRREELLVELDEAQDDLRNSENELQDAQDDLEDMQYNVTRLERVCEEFEMEVARIQSDLDELEEELGECEGPPIDEVWADSTDPDQLSCIQ